MKCCHRCGAPWESAKKQPAVKETCEQCGSYLHCCLNCRHYAPHAHNKCYIPTTDWVGDRAGCNFCDEFEFRQAAGPNRGAGKQDGARGALDTLFGEEGAGNPKPEGRDAFDDLFGG